MKPEQSPFPAAWWGTSLEDVGLYRQRPNVPTYGGFEYSGLPELPVSLNGTFGWLQDEQSHKGHIGIERRKENELALPILEAVCASADLPVPSTFWKFFQSPDLQARIRSNTDCFLDLARRPVPSPGEEGTLIRFLADSQGCVFWYLFIQKRFNDHAVVSSENFYDAEIDLGGDHNDANAPEIVLSEETFERFLCRFWIENELWFSGYDHTPLSDICREYRDAYLDSPGDPLRN